MTKSADNLRFYGDLESGVYKASLGSTLPTTMGALDAAFDEVGWLGDDGVPFDREVDTQEVNAYQATRLLRSKTTLKKETLKFNCLEDNLVSLGIVYPGATITTAAGVHKIEPTGQVTDNAAWVFESKDGAITKRYCVINGDAAVTGTIEHKSTDPTVFEVELTLNEYYILSDNPAYV